MILLNIICNVLLGSFIVKSFMEQDINTLVAFILIFVIHFQVIYLLDNIGGKK